MWFGSNVTFKEKEYIREVIGNSAHLTSLLWGNVKLTVGILRMYHGLVSLFLFIFFRVSNKSQPD